MGLLDIGNYLTDPGNSANLGLISGLLQASAPSRLPISTTQAIGMGIQGANAGRMNSIQMQQAQQQLEAQQFNNMMTRAMFPTKLAAMQTLSGQGVPSDPSAAPSVSNQAPSTVPSPYDNQVNQVDPNAPYMAAPNPAISAQPYAPQAGTPSSQPTQGLLNPSAQPTTGLAQFSDAEYAQRAQRLQAANYLGIKDDVDNLWIQAYNANKALTPEQKLASDPRFGNAYVAKTNYVAPVNARPGAILRDPVTMQPVAFNPHIPDGASPVFDASGNVVAMQPINGATDIMQRNAYASAAGSKGYAPSTPTPNTPPAGGSRFVGYGGNQPTSAPAYGPGSDAAISTMATDNAKRASATVQAASGSPERVNVLDNILQLSEAGVNTGPTAAWQNHIKGIIASTPLLSSAFPNFKGDVSDFQELQKFTYQNGLRAWQAAGGTGTDAQMESFSHANPNDRLFPQAMQQIAQWAKAGELATQAKANAQDDWLARNGNNPQAQNQFESTWRNNFEPRIYQLQVMNPQQRLQFMQKTFPTLYPKPGQSVKPDPVQQAAYNALVRKEQFARQNGWIQ